jgi:PAS domain S-box-containing protein
MPRKRGPRFGCESPVTGVGRLGNGYGDRPVASKASPVNDRHKPDARTPATSDHHDHGTWVATWTEAVEASGRIAALVELPSTRFIAVSPRTAELLGITAEAATGLDYLALVERREDVAVGLRLVMEGTMDGIRARRRLRRADGSLVEVTVCGQSIRSSAGPDLGLWIACDAPAVGQRRPSGAPVARPAQLEMPSPFAADLPAMGRLDQQWRVAQVSIQVERRLGVVAEDLIGCWIVDLTHPGDVGVLLLTFARATSDSTASTPIRLRRGDGSWSAVQLVLSRLDGEGPTSFAFHLGTTTEADPGTVSMTVLGITQRLRGIAAELDAAATLGGLAATPHVRGGPASLELSDRQSEILTRLLAGQRVRTMSAEMYLSQNTVRNHLSAIFRKVGVHSQQELLALWARTGPGQPSTRK